VSSPCALSKLINHHSSTVRLHSCQGHIQKGHCILVVTSVDGYQQKAPQTGQDKCMYVCMSALVTATDGFASYSEGCRLV